MNELEHELSQGDIEENNLNGVAEPGDTVNIPLEENTGGGGGVDEDVPTISVPQFEVLSEGFYRCSCGKLLSQGYSTCPSCERQLK